MKNSWSVIDLFSGAGGMSFGFHASPGFRVIGAVDAEIGKPSSGIGALQCNATYEANIGIRPAALDLATATPDDLRAALGTVPKELTVLCSCAPCTGFSRTRNCNHTVDDPRNSLIGRTVLFVEAYRPSIVLMENAREFIHGRFDNHFLTLEKEFLRLGYTVCGEVHMLSRFGLPQQRERAIVIAVRKGMTLRRLDDLWEDYKPMSVATQVRRAIGELPAIGAGETHPGDVDHACPAMGEENVRRLRHIPRDGGSWADLRHHPERGAILTGAMLRNIARDDFGSHPDVYGRMAWDRPAPTIKRECGHIGNGRYAHPEQDRLCSVREMAILQGFPREYVFRGNSLTNRYRHIGDAVPPLISYQLAAACRWMLTGVKPEPEEFLLSGTHLTIKDLALNVAQRNLFAG